MCQCCCHALAVGGLSQDARQTETERGQNCFLPSQLCYLFIYPIATSTALLFSSLPSLLLFLPDYRCVVCSVKVKQRQRPSKQQPESASCTSLLSPATPRQLASQQISLHGAHCLSPSLCSKHNMSPLPSMELLPGKGLGPFELGTDTCSIPAIRNDSLTEYFHLGMTLFNTLNYLRSASAYGPFSVSHDAEVGQQESRQVSKRNAHVT